MSSTIATNIQRIRQISPPKGEFGDLLRVVGDDQTDLMSLVELIDLCPMVTARLLQCANSAYFGQGGRIHSVREAVIRVLGLQLTRSLTLAFLLSDSFDTDQAPNFDPHRHWFTALVTANLASEMAANLRHKYSAPGIYTAGLIHNIGLQALTHAFPEEMNHALQSSTETLAQKTQALFNLDHYQAGALLVRNWKLPKAIVEPLYYLRNPNYQGENWQSVQLLRLSSHLATIFYNKDTYALRNYKAPSELITQPYLEKAIFGIEEQLATMEEISQILTYSQN